MHADSAGNGRARRLSGVLGLGMAATVALAGCGAAASPTSSSAAPASSASSHAKKTKAASSAKPNVVIGYENAPDPEMVAIAQHDFAKYMHAHVTMKYYSSGPAALASLASGSLQFMTVLGNPPVVTAIAHGVPLQVVWAMEQYTTAEGLVVRKGHHITSLKGLEGHHVALVQGSTSPFVLSTALKSAGVPASKVTFTNMTPPEMVAAWKRKSINAAYVWVPFFSTMVNSGGKALMYDKNEATAAPIFNLAVANRSFAAKHPHITEGFIKAEAAGYASYKAHPNAAYKAMGKLNQISASEAKSQASGLRFISLKGQLGSSGMGTPSTVGSSLVTKSLTSAAAWLKSVGAIRKVPSNMSSYVNPSFAQKVEKSGFKG